MMRQSSSIRFNWQMSYLVGSMCNASWDASLMRRMARPSLKYGPMASGQAPYANMLTKWLYAR
jgi:hypothetical protein